jgi:hypothetical protein
MVEKPTGDGPRLEVLLDQRDQLRLQISKAEGAHGESVADLRRQLMYLEQEIEQQWGLPQP